MKKTNKNISNYQPEVKIGDTVYYIDTIDNYKITKSKVIKIVFVKDEYESYYEYHCSNGIRFRYCGERFHLSKKEAKKSILKLIKKEIEAIEKAIDIYKKEKLRLENLLKLKKTK